jgi:predicted Zn-dependent peptidase
MEAKEPAQKAMILVNYVIAGEKSPYLTRLSKKEIKRFDAEKTKAAFDKAIKHSANIFYCGTKPVTEVEGVIKSNLTLNNSIKGTGLAYEAMKSYDKNLIFFLHHKKALQSNIYLYMTSNNRTKESDPYVDAFNTYFDGGFSGIVLQEIRESRSLAYSAWASVIQPQFNNKPNFMLGNVATQTDKTFEALDVFKDLIRNMPEKPERIDMIRKYLIGSTISNNPHFRDISESIEDWKRRGYTNNPADDKIKVYEDMKFDDIVKFYKENIKDKPYVTIIVGDKKKVDMKKLSEYGEVKILKLKNIYKK